MVASRLTNAASILFRVLCRYQPGGLGERSKLLHALVEVKPPTSISILLNNHRSWRRWLGRINELNVLAPDPTLLMRSLDHFSSFLSKASVQAGFRLSAVRARLQVDTNPTLGTVVAFSEVLTGEAEAQYHGGSELPLNTTKVKAVNTELPQGQAPGQGRPAPIMEIRNPMYQDSLGVLKVRIARESAVPFLHVSRGV